MPRREMTVAADLREMGLKAFVPIEIVKVRAGRGPSRMKLREVERPFFPGYLFAQVAMDIQAWLAIKGNDHVAGIVSGNVDGRPTPVPDAAMAHLIAAGPFRERDAKPGDVVRISTGPLAGTLTRIMAVDKSERIKVLIQFMGADRPIDLHLSEVERMPDGYAAHRTA
jgi:transcription antitermination factor NusG